MRTLALLLLRLTRLPFDLLAHTLSALTAWADNSADFIHESEEELRREMGRARRRKASQARLEQTVVRDIERIGGTE